MTEEFAKYVENERSLPHTSKHDTRRVFVVQEHEFTRQTSLKRVETFPSTLTEYSRE